MTHQPRPVIDLACKNVCAATKAKLRTLRAALDPFALAQDIERRLTEIFALVEELQEETWPESEPAEEIPPPAADVAKNAFATRQLIL